MPDRCQRYGDEVERLSSPMNGLRYGLFNLRTGEPGFPSCKQWEAKRKCIMLIIQARRWLSLASSLPATQVLTKGTTKAHQARRYSVTNSNISVPAYGYLSGPTVCCASPDSLTFPGARCHENGHMVGGEHSSSSTTAAIPPLHRPMGHCIAAITPYRRGLPHRETAQLESAGTLWPWSGGRCLAPITSSEFAHAPLPEC